MIKNIAACLLGGLFICTLVLAGEEVPNCKAKAYWDLQELYWSVEESGLDERTKALELQEISDRMSKLLKIKNEEYCNGTGR